MNTDQSLSTQMPAQSAPNPYTIMPLGDSITAGKFFEGGYRIKLWQTALADNWDIQFVGSQYNGLASLGSKHHEGHPGYRIDQIAQLVDDKLATYKPQMVLLYIGANDAVQNHDIANADRRLQGLIQQIFRDRPTVHLLVAKLGPSAHSEVDANIQMINAAIPVIVRFEQAQGHSIKLVDMSKVLTTDDLEDGLHLKPEGYNKMADQWFKAVQPLFDVHVQTPDHPGAGSAGGSGVSLAIEPMTTIGANGAGYLADPQPVRLAPSSDHRVQILSGTTKAIIQCTFPIKPNGFSWTKVKVNVEETLRHQIETAGSTVTNIQNVNLFQDDQGGWHGAVAIDIESPKYPADHWTILAHAHPTGAAAPGSAPLSWLADTLLSGSFSNRVDGNYDAKYFEDAGQLYLLYVQNVVPKPNLRNVIVIQRMLSPTAVAPEPPVTLLTTGDRDGDELTSESYNTHAKLVEAPYLSRINGKYALVYSTGAYLTASYKAGVAWSDTLLPSPGEHYRKVLAADEKGIWGAPGRDEVRYLVQSQKPDWPNFTGQQVIAPGVASAIQDPGSTWWLYFNGFAPDDMRDPTGKVNATHRRPYYLRLRAAVPQDRSVLQATDLELQQWLQPETREALVSNLSDQVPQSDFISQ